MVVKIVIVISVTLVLGVGAWSLVASVTAPILEPKVKITEMHFSPGSCQGEYFLFWRTGEHRMVQATFSLSNTGLSAGEAAVVFTVDGAKIDQADFFIGAGQAEGKTWQFTVGDCAGHEYGAYLGDVRQK